MSKKFQSLTVKDVVHETPEAFSIYFKNPGTDAFKYKPGQYLILQAEVEGRPLRRAFSLSTSPFLDDDLAVTIKCIEEGRVSNYLHQNLKSGQSLEVMPPQGNFTVDIHPDNSHHYVLIGGGSGITPLMSILRSVLSQEPESRVSLLYANRDVESTIFNKRLKELEKKYKDRFYVIHALDNPPENWQGISGRLDEDAINKVLDEFSGLSDQSQTYYLCGPPGMMELAKKVLTERGIEKSDVRQEHFTASLPETEATPETEAEEEEEASSDSRPEKATVTIILDEEEFTIEVGPQETILEAAIDAGIDPPFACQEGICTTCQAMLHKGRVHMEEDEGLTEDEMDEGYILTCQSHPLTKEVKVEYE